MRQCNDGAIKIDVMDEHDMIWIYDKFQRNSLYWGGSYEAIPLFLGIFLAFLKHILTAEYHVYIWQVSPQISCADTCQIWMWFK